MLHLDEHAVHGGGPIGIEDNFFDLGGHSLLAVRLLDHIKGMLGKRLPLATPFSSATVPSMAETLQRDEALTQSPLVPLQPGGARRPFFFLHGDLLGGGLYYRRLAQHLGPDRPFYVLNPHGVGRGLGRSSPTVRPRPEDSRVSRDRPEDRCSGWLPDDPPAPVD